MSNNFNPGFDQKKADFIELANRGEGLTPIEYIYAGNASFESVLASYLKGGMIDINMLYVTNIDATDIVTVTLEAKIATIDTATIDTAYITNLYSDSINNKDKITTKDLFVSHSLTVGKVNDLATIEFHPSAFLVAGGETSFFLGYFSVTAGIMSFTDATSFSVNSPLVSINYVEGALKFGAVGIYSGGLMDINAPKIQIGDPTKLGVETLTISMKPDISFTCESGIVNITGKDEINLTSNNEIKCITDKITAKGIGGGGGASNDWISEVTIACNDFVVVNQGLGSINFKYENGKNKFKVDVNECSIFAGDECSIFAGDINIEAAKKNISLKAAGTISVDSPGTIPGTPVPVEGGGALIADFIPPLPVSGKLIFTLPNVVTCEGGKLVTVDYIVTLTCVV